MSSENCIKNNRKRKMIGFADFTFLQTLPLFSAFFRSITSQTNIQRKKCLSLPGVQFSGMKAPILLMNTFYDPEITIM